ncbi:MAG TPA: hypothetical protein VFQ05_04055 [Candidatus Eisenbacteria bacterium]|nr:hypothetical protein [Candidatus Eisenbacteria bacterium]
MLVLAFFYLARARFLHGDAAVYAHQIETRAFGERTLHLLYYLVGWLVVQATKPLGISTDTSLIVFSGLLMTAALWLSWHLYRSIGEDQRTSVWALFVLLFAGVVLQQGTEAEVYALQLVLSVASYLAYVRGRPVVAGISLGLATLTTPLAVLIVGFFAAEAIRTRQWKPFLVMGVVGALTFLPVLALVWRDYFYGTRGLLVDSNVAQTSAKGIDNAVAIVKNFHFMLPFLAVGLVIAWRRRPMWIGALAGLLVSHIIAILTVTEDGVFLLPIYPIIAVIIAFGVVAGLERSGTRAMTRLTLALYALTSLLVWLQPYDQKMRQGMLEGLRKVPPGSIIVTSWSYAMTLDYYAGPPRDTLLASRQLLWPEEHSRVAAALRGTRPVFMMESHAGTRSVHWLYPPAMQRRHYAQFSLMPRLERTFGVKATPYFATRGGPIFYRLSLP